MTPQGDAHDEYENPLATRILSGGNDPTTGQAEPGVSQLSDQMRQLANFDLTKYTP